MLIINPAFLQQTPSRKVEIIILFALFFTVLPLLNEIPNAVIGIFMLVWSVRLCSLYFKQLDLNKIPRIMIFFAGLICMGWVYLQLGTIMGQEGGISLLLLMVLLKSYECRNFRDWQVLLLAMVFLIGSSVLFNQTLLVGLWLFTELIILSICFAMLCGVSFKTSFKNSLLAFGLTLPLMTVLFISVPRSSYPLWGIPQPDSSKSTTGLSDTMQPGSISELVQSNELMANVIFTEGSPKPEDLYWRAMIMSDFDGLSWKAVDSSYRDEAQPQNSSGQKFEYEMILRDEKGVIPALDYPYTTHQRGVNVRLGDVIRVRSRDNLQRIVLTSYSGDLLPHRINSGERAANLALPPNGNMRTRQLANDLRAKSQDAVDFINQTLNHYRTNQFAYTLEPPKMLGNNGTDEFMFSHKQGFCEHYAQSFVIMMRAAGIPARVVAGYQGGEYQEDIGLWQIRSRHAHVWAEVFLEDKQAWWRIDPTAMVSDRVISGINNTFDDKLLTQMPYWKQLLENGQFYWQQWVVNYDAASQNSLFDKLGLEGFNKKTASIVLSIGLFIAAIPMIAWWQRNRRREQEPLVEGFWLIKMALLDDDDDLMPSYTASELMDLMQQNQLEDETIIALLNEYQTWLYATDSPPDSPSQRAWLAKVKKAVKKYFD